MRNTELLCCFLLAQLLLVPICAAVPIVQGIPTGLENANVANGGQQQHTALIRKRRATSSLLKGAAIGAVLGIAGAAAYNLYKNRQQNKAPATTGADEEVAASDRNS